LALALASLSCGGPSPENAADLPTQPRAGGTLVLGSISDVDSWNECLSRQTLSANLLRRVYLRLAQVQGDEGAHPPTYRPLLAESWERSADGTALTFRLREATWSDGQPIRAADVRFTWLAQTAPESTWVGLDNKRRIVDVEVLDDRTVRFHFDADYPGQLADAVEGGILPEHRFGEVPFPEWSTFDWSTLSIGSGPFVLERHQQGHEIVLRRNERYFDQPFPLLDRIVVRVVPDSVSLMTQLRTGEIDYTDNVTPRDAEALREEPGITVAPFDYPEVHFIGWNGSREPFDDPEVRRALTMAIDREALVTDLLYGYGRVSVGPVFSYLWAADRRVRALPYDPGQARQILESRGYVTGAGALPASGARRLEFELLTNSGNRLRESMLVKVQEQLARIGVHAKLRPVEMRTLGRRVTSGEYDAFLMGLSYGLQDLGSIFGSESVPPRGANYVFYRSPRIDGLLAEVDGAPSWEAMKPALDALQHQVHSDQPYTFLYESKRIAAYRNRARDLQIEIPSDPLAGLERVWIDAP
jgi:peptide/nickel transport system substrate-binding protein